LIASVKSLYCFKKKLVIVIVSDGVGMEYQTGYRKGSDQFQTKMFLMYFIKLKHKKCAGWAWGFQRYIQGNNCSFSYE
jgi:hypothetical protein